MELRGRPEISVAVAAGRVTLTQRDPLKRGVVWPQKLQLTVGYKESCKREQVTADLKGASVSVRVAGEPVYVLPTGGGIGYGGIFFWTIVRGNICWSTWKTFRMR